MQSENGIFTSPISIRWADLDANFHLRHSVYFDFGAQQRLDVFNNMGLTLELMREQHIGPVLLREECIFRREIRLNDHVVITMKLAKVSADGAKWTIQHEFFSMNQKLLASITVDGGWIDTRLRKFAATTPHIVKEVFDRFPRSSSFSES